MDEDQNIHESIERSRDEVPLEVEAARKAKQSLSVYMIFGVVLVGAAVILAGFFTYLGIRGVQNQPDADPFADYQLLIEEREKKLEEIENLEIEDIDRGFAERYEIWDEQYGTQVSVSVGATERTIIANGIPNHATGSFPNASNPNAISQQQFIFDLPINPIKNDEPTFYNVPQPFGIAINGVIFDPFAAEYYNNNKNSGWQITGIVNNLGFDSNNAHVQPDGTYHYHGPPTGLVDESVQLIGFAGDGYPIYSVYGYEDVDSTKSDIIKLKSSYKIKSGNRPNGPGGRYDGTYEEDYEFIESHGDLDECNGRFGVTNEFPEGTYHYVVTEEYPYIGRCHWGDIAESFVVDPR